jgi:hypothetical protein
MQSTFTGGARGREQDVNEAWLSANDPDYANSRKAWQVSTQDALARASTGTHATRSIDDVPVFDRGDCVVVGYDDGGLALIEEDEEIDEQDDLLTLGEYLAGESSEDEQDE